MKYEVPKLSPPIPFEASDTDYILGLRDSSGVHIPINNTIEDVRRQQVQASCLGNPSCRPA